jgi:hypothetical protein|uniref:Uncharacterized protein n=1 Tax=Podoviridae sp. ctRnx2 TaxID=2826555 RepID=A0A8S5QT69_9CAUD|nr:MAG TPA: hypothetical protein [Podoviridae sp. ctRnx2]
MIVSGNRYMLLTTRKGAVSDLVEVYGNDSLEEFRQHVQRHYPAACITGQELDGLEYVVAAWTHEDRAAAVKAIRTLDKSA